jgi:hypothetical protein
MNAKHWSTVVAAAALALAGCNQSGGESTIGAAASPLTAVAAASEARHLRVQVSYESGRFQVEGVTEVASALKQPRSRRTRAGVQYLARLPGQVTFAGHMSDPRRVHLEAPDATGKLQRVEVAAPGRQHFLVLVPVGTETVDFFEGAAPQAAGLQAQAAQSVMSTTGSASALIGSIDLRGVR